MNPIFVAIDTPDLDRARRIAEAVRGHAGGLKLGLEFFAANGPAACARIAELGLPIFLDLKLHDIPNTVAKAVAALAPLEPAILTVHAAGGRAMLEAAKAAAPTGTKVVAVTVLTSLDADDLAATGVDAARQRTRSRGWPGSPANPGSTASSAPAPKLPRARGLAGGLFRRARHSPAGADAADQKRVVTPREALDDGASVLVIGRPITGAADPARAIARHRRRPVADARSRGLCMSWLSRVRSGIPFLPKRQTRRESVAQVRQVRDDGVRQGMGRELQRLPALRLP